MTFYFVLSCLHLSVAKVPVFYKFYFLNFTNFLKLFALRLVIEFFCKIDAVVVAPCLTTNQYTTQQILPAHSITTNFKTKTKNKKEKQQF